MPPKPDASASRRASSTLDPRLTALALTILRVFLGAQFVIAGATKWDWIGTPILARTLAHWAANYPPALDWHARFLTQTALPHAALFTYLVVFGELGVGLCLLLGLLTRFASLLALVLSANYLFATWTLGSTWQGYNEAFLAMELALLLSGAGRAYGLDMRLARKYPRCPLW